MRAISLPPGVVDRATVDRVINQTQRAVVEASRDLLTNQAELGADQKTTFQLADEVGTFYRQEMVRRTSSLVGMDQDELLRIVRSAAKNVIDQTNNQWLPVAGFKSLNKPEVNKVATAAVSAVSVAANAIVSASKFQPPDDVSCSMAVLTWQETSDIFGRRVANTYIAIQVTVRNLNTTNEFLIHDIQVAVDTGLDPDSFSRFTAGRDKLLVRAVAQRGQSEDRRNLALNSLLAIGAIASSVTLLNPANEFATAVAVFQGGFIPGFKTLFPDHTVEQLNHINDLVFSASSVNKVIVPIQGSVPLVTFISTKPVEQMPFAWCGYTKQTHTSLGNAHRQECEYGQPEQVGGYPNNYSFPKPGNGQAENAPQVPEDGQAKNKPQARENGQAENMPQAPWDSLDYKKWQPAALRILQNQTFVVIGGVHIKQLTNEPGKVNSLSCPKLPSGSIDISATKDGLVICSVTGTNLDSVTSVNLEKGTDKIAGKIKAAKDGNSADLQFDPAALSDGAGIYELMLVDKSSNELDSGEAVQLEVQLITSADSSLDLAKPTLTIKGKHLDKLESVSLVADDGSVANGTLAAPGADGASISVSFPTGLTSGKQYFVRYKVKGSTNQVDLKTIVVKATGTAPPAPLVPPPNRPQADKSGTGNLAGVQPKITSADGSLDLAKPTLTIKGEHLDQLGKVWLVPDDGSTPTQGKPVAVGASRTSIAVSFPTGLTSGKQYFVRYQAKRSTPQASPPPPVDLKAVVVKVTGTAPPAPPPTQKK